MTTGLTRKRTIRQTNGINRTQRKRIDGIAEHNRELVRQTIDRILDGVEAAEADHVYGSLGFEFHLQNGQILKVTRTANAADKA